MSILTSAITGAAGEPLVREMVVAVVLSPLGSKRAAMRSASMISEFLLTEMVSL